MFTRKQLHALTLALAFSWMPAAAQAVAGPTWNWSRMGGEAPAPRSDACLTYDEARGRWVIFGGYASDGFQADTWEMRDGAWERKSPVLSPPARSRAAMVYHPASRKTLLVGGALLDQPGALADVWEWDGTAWTTRAGATGPAARSGHSMVVEPGGGRVLLFGGMLLTGKPSQETWAWDGKSWALLQPEGSPAARSNHAMTADPDRRRIVLFGGSADPSLSWSGGSTESLVREAVRARQSSPGPFGDTWEWDGKSWAHVAAESAPTPRSSHAMSYDAMRHKVVLVGGKDGYGDAMNDTWEWDGKSWRRAEAPQVLPSRAGCAMSRDPVSGRLVLLGGYGRGYLGDLWQWDAGKWTEVPSVAGKSPAITHYAAGYDAARNRAVLFGGLPQKSFDPVADTWEFDGKVWTQARPATAPPARYNARMAWDEKRGRLVLFGGEAYGPSDDTWEYDGSNWLKLQPPHSPPARRQHAMAYDPVRSRVVLHGGAGKGGNLLGDTWAWDGRDWTAIPGEGPSQRQAHRMAPASPGGPLLLFGGWGDNGRLADTWLLGAQGWTKSNPARSPSPRQDFQLAFDPASGVLVLFSGAAESSRSDTWVWNGHTWSEVPAAGSPPPRDSAALLPDAGGKGLLLCPGLSSGGSLDGDCWRLKSSMGGRQ